MLYQAYSSIVLVVFFLLFYFQFFMYIFNARAYNFEFIAHRRTLHTGFSFHLILYVFFIFSFIFCENNRRMDFSGAPIFLINRNLELFLLPCLYFSCCSFNVCLCFLKKCLLYTYTNEWYIEYINT